MISVTAKNGKPHWTGRKAGGSCLTPMRTIRLPHFRGWGWLKNGYSAPRIGGSTELYFQAETYNLIPCNYTFL